jgi:uncharacterized protein
LSDLKSPIHTPLFFRAPTAFLAILLLLGCGREKIIEKYPDGHPKTIRTYGWFGGETEDNLKRVQTFYFNNHKEADTHFKAGQRHGPFRDFTMKGQKKSEGQFVEGKKAGEWTFYYNQFTVSAKGRFENNLKQGRWHQYWENGDTRAEGNFKDGKEIDTLKEWSQKGEPTLENSCFESNERGHYLTFHAQKLIKEKYACHRGVPVGEYTRLDPEGMAVEKGSFDDQGRKQGLWETFHADGKLASRKHFQAGLENDSAYAWDPYGRLKERGFFQSGAGELLGYDSLGNLIERRHYSNSHPEGEAWVYYPRGGKRSLVLYKDGQPAELSKWHPNGKLMAQGIFLNGKRHGIWKTYAENGKLNETSEYREGKLHGDQFFYDAQGQLTRTLRYEHGYPAEGKIPSTLAAGLNNPIPKKKDSVQRSDSGPLSKD